MRCEGICNEGKETQEYRKIHTDERRKRQGMKECAGDGGHTKTYKLIYKDTSRLRADYKQITNRLQADNKGQPVSS